LHGKWLLDSSVPQVVFKQQYNSSNYNIENGQWNEHFPSQAHELIISESWYGPADPHKEEDEEEDFTEEDNSSENRHHIV
jgi:hypothetical protein